MGSAVTEAQEIVEKVKEDKYRKLHRKAARKFAKRVSKALGKMIGSVSHVDSEHAGSMEKYHEPITRIGDSIQHLLDLTKKPKN
jgi:hypothetical protein